MGSERPLVSNPKGNNRNLLVTATGQSGRTIRLALLKPGESFRPEKAEFSVKEVARPLLLTHNPAAPGTYTAAF
jgi:hypothetical protein